MAYSVILSTSYLPHIYLHMIDRYISRTMGMSQLHIDQTRSFQTMSAYLPSLSTQDRGKGSWPFSRNSLLCNWYRVYFPGENRAGCGVNHPPPFSAEVKERVQLCLYSPCGPSWPVLGRNLYFTLPFSRKTITKSYLMTPEPSVIRHSVI
jgi:hypothetical protein